MAHTVSNGAAHPTRWFRAAALIGSIAGGASFAHAQNAPSADVPSGSVSPVRGGLAGQVVLADGRPAVGATLAIDSGNGEIVRAETDAQGRFRVDDLVAGSYAITVLGPGGEQADTRVDIAAGTQQLEVHLPGAAGTEIIEVHGLSAAVERRQSADAVTVVETDRAKRETADLGEVLARTKGVAVRRSGGLGSGAALLLAGLAGEQIRFFVDGLPLYAVGFPFGIANVPVNLVDRVEVYSGVVPVRFGADALGGAVNLVTSDRAPGTHGAASFEAGSFDTDRITLSGRHRTAAGLYARIDGFFDHARNDYVVSVREPNSLGQLSEIRVHRFHDGYDAGGGVVELGVIDKSWAKRLAMRGFASGYDKQYQHDPLMQRVYGDVTYGERSGGGSARYQQTFGDLALDAVAGYVFTRGRFQDVSTCVYNWFGQCILHNQPGEIGATPFDERTWEHAAFARLYGSWTIRPDHELRLSIAPTYTTRSGDDREITVGRDPLSAERTIGAVVSGLEYQVDVIDRRLENIAFAKHYAQRLRSEDPEPGGMFIPRDRNTQRLGLGDAVRYRFTDALYAKLAYEWATRLPTPNEVFGDNTFIVPNLELAPEVSHNLNLGLAIDGLRTPAGVFSAAATGFWREIDDLIEPFAVNADESFQNVFGARSLGVEAAGEWTCPGGYLVVDGTATYQSFRNDSSDGPYGAFDGDRIPNRPYLFGSGTVRFQLHDRVVPHDEITVTYGLRYTHAFDRDWDSLGANEHVIPTQWLHSAAVGYRVRGERADLSTTLEVANVTDADTFDYFRVQRPGRAFYVKMAAEF